MKKYTMTILPAFFMMFSCKDAIVDTGPAGGSGGTNTVRAEIAAYAGGAAELQDEDGIASMEAYHFDGGKLVRTYNSFSGSGDSSAGGGKVFGIDLDSRSGTLYVVAAGPDGPDYVRPQEGESETAWLSRAVAVSEDGHPGHFYTGKTGLSGSGVLQVALERGMARFDMKIDVAGKAEVRSLTFGGTLYEAPLFRGTVLSSPSSGDMKVTFETPVTEDRKGVAYLFGQDNPSLSVTVDAIVDGKECTLGAELPDHLERNTVYTLTVRKDHISADLELSVSGWNDGGEIEMTPDRSRLVVNAESGTLPSGVQVSEDGRTLVLPYGKTEFILDIDSDDELELLPYEGHLLSVEPVAETGGYDGVNRFMVRKGLFAPNVPSGETVLAFRRKGLGHSYPEDAITLKLAANPTVLSGTMSFDNVWYEHDFRKYADNEFGVFNLPPEKELLVEFAPGEDEWMKAERSAGDGNSWRIVGGWRPNDPTADGRDQKAVIVIRNRDDGSSREEYTVVRRNYGLPVTWLHGVWWCKYNAMGDSRSFDDQILSSEDPAVLAGQTLSDYLASCPPELYRELWGWSYIGDSGRGMRVVDSGGKAVLDGYSGGQTVHINKLPADALSPAGYELPTMEEFNRIFDATDYVWVMWGGKYSLKTPWEGHSAMKMVQRRKNDVPLGSLTLSNLIYFSVASEDFPDNEPLVWYGPGAQWNADGIYHNGHYNNMLFAVHSPEGYGWFIAGGMENLYLHKNGAGNNDTRILRFKKSDVEYIY